MAGSGLGWQGADQALVATAATRAAEAKPTKAKSHASSSGDSALHWRGYISENLKWLNLSLKGAVAFVLS